MRGVGAQGWRGVSGSARALPSAQLAAQPVPPRGCATHVRRGGPKEGQQQGCTASLVRSCGEQLVQTPRRVQPHAAPRPAPWWSNLCLPKRRVSTPARTPPPRSTRCRWCDATCVTPARAAATAASASRARTAYRMKSTLRRRRRRGVGDVSAQSLTTRPPGLRCAPAAQEADEEDGHRPRAGALRVRSRRERTLIRAGQRARSSREHTQAPRFGERAPHAGAATDAGPGCSGARAAREGRRCSSRV